jgi:hypothetical protein
LGGAGAAIFGMIYFIDGILANYKSQIGRGILFGE